MVGHAGREGEVFLRHGAVLELVARALVRAIVFGDENRAARVAVEPMHDAGARGPAELAEFVEMVTQGRGERAFPVASAGMHDHAGRLVDDGDGVVFVENFQRNGGRQRAFTRELGERNGDDVAGAHAHRGFGALAIDADPLHVDRLAYVRATIRRERLRDEPIEADAGVFVGDRHVDGGLRGVGKRHRSRRRKDAALGCPPTTCRRRSVKRSAWRSRLVRPSPRRWESCSWPKLPPRRCRSASLRGTRLRSSAVCSSRQG